MVDRFQMGETVRLSAQFKTPKTASPPSELFDPTLVSLRIKYPDKTVQTFVFGTDAEVETEGVGLYFSRLSLDQEGTYYWRWTGSSITSSGVQSGVFDSIREPNF